MMVIFSEYSGFSSALGAFVMGSILAGTSAAERISKVVSPVKDLFGAIFFVSVGMMVDPHHCRLHVAYPDTVVGRDRRNDCVWHIWNVAHGPIAPHCHRIRLLPHPNR